MSTATSGGAGGNPPIRPDQTTSPPAAVITPGGAAGVFKGRLVIVFGSGYSGVFVYSPAPGAGNLVASLTAVSGTDPYGNTYRGPGLDVQGSGREIVAALFGSIPELQFRTNAAFEQNVANIAGGPAGSGATEFLELVISGPQGSTASGTDWTQVQLVSNTEGATSFAAGYFNYIDTAAVAHLIALWSCQGFTINAGSVTAVAPGTGTVTTPATPETWHTFSLSVGSAGNDINGTSYPPAYRLLPTGDVAIRGAWVPPGGGYTSGTTWTTIPAAYRPATNIPSALIGNAATSTLSHVYIRPNGNVQFNTNIGAGTTMYLDSILLVNGT